MVASRVLMVVAVWSALLHERPLCAADQKPPAPEKVVVFSFPGIDADEFVDLAKSRLGYTKIARIPLFNAAMVWGTGEELVGVLRSLTPL